MPPARSVFALVIIMVVVVVLMWFIVCWKWVAVEAVLSRPGCGSGKRGAFRFCFQGKTAFKLHRLFGGSEKRCFWIFY